MAETASASTELLVLPVFWTGQECANSYFFFLNLRAAPPTLTPPSWGRRRSGAQVREE